MKKNIFLSLLTILIVNFSGCNSSLKSESTYEKKNQNSSVETEPKSYRKYALVSSGTIEVKKTLTTDGPLADVHANGEINARSLSLEISGKITSENDLSGSIVRSFDYDSPLNNSGFVEIRALKVDEYLNTHELDEYYLLSSDGKAVHKIKDEDDKAINNSDVQFIFENNSWTIKGDSTTLRNTLVVQSDLNINMDYLFVTGTLMVQGNLVSNGELNINTGTPFDKALIVDNNIEVNKLVVIGRVHGSGTFISQNEVNILGNAEIDGDVTLYGDAKINFLDNVYKSALYEAQQEADENNTSLILAHSQLFSNAKGKNSVVLFTFVEGNYIINENTINKLIETNQINEFKFKSYLYGATLDYGAELQRFDGLSPYFRNKQELLKTFASQGYEGVRISESLDIAPSNLYHTFKDKDNNLIGTYQVYSMANSFDVNNLVDLTKEERANAIYGIDHKDELELEQEVEAKKKQEEQKQSIIDNNDLNFTIKSEMLNEITEAENNETSIDKVAVKAEAQSDRVQEWVEYKDLASDTIETDVNTIIVEEATQARGWFSRIRRAVRRVFRRVTFQDCRKRYKYGKIKYVNSASSFSNDRWSREISLNNNGNNYCVPISASMVLNYHRLRKGKSSLYSTNRSVSERTLASTNNNYVEKMANKFHTSKNRGTDFWRLYRRVPHYITSELRSNHTYGYSWSYYTAHWNRAWHFRTLSWYIRTDNPIMYSTSRKVARIDGSEVKNHTMPVIGYKLQYYKGSCWKRIMPNRKWILVDTTWRHSATIGDDTQYRNSRGYIRFDNRSNYWTIGTMTYIRSW